MARSSGNHSHSQQQPASPKQATAVPEPKLVFGQEALGREISVFQSGAKQAEWWDGKVTEFNSDSGQHLVQYHGREHRAQQWLQLNEQPFQWKSAPASTAASSPTVKGINLDDSILGRKVKVFWPAMCKWYLGHIKEFDAKSGRHTIKYKDGEIKDYALRHEAVWWLDGTTDIKLAASPRSKGRSAGSHSGNQGLRKQPTQSTGRTPAATDASKHRQKRTLAAELLQPPTLAAVKTSPALAETASPQSGAISPQKKTKTGAAATSPRTGTHSSRSSTGNANELEDDSVSQSSCSRGPAGLLHAKLLHIV